MTPVEIMQAGKTAFDLIRAIAGEVTKSQNAAEALEFTTKTAELGGLLSEMQAALLELTRENDDLRRLLAERSRLDTIERRLLFEENVYWDRRADGTRDGPYCPNCWDDRRKLIRLNRGSDPGLYHCVFHKESLFETAEHKSSANFAVVASEKSIFDRDF